MKKSKARRLQRFLGTRESTERIAWNLFSQAGCAPYSARTFEIIRQRSAFAECC